MAGSSSMSAGHLVGRDLDARRSGRPRRRSCRAARRRRSPVGSTAHARAEAPQDVEERRPGRVQADVLDLDPRARAAPPRPPSRTRRTRSRPGPAALARREALAAGDGRRVRPSTADVDAERRERPLGVVARRRRLGRPSSSRRRGGRPGARRSSPGRSAPPGACAMACSARAVNRRAARGRRSPRCGRPSARAAR